MKIHAIAFGRALTVIALLASVNFACGGVEEGDPLLEDQAADELSANSLANAPVNSYWLLQNGRYTDIYYTQSPATIRNALGAWTSDGNVLRLFASASACAGAVPLYQCSPYPNAYSHYVGTGCYSGSNPVLIGRLGFVCPTVNGNCPAGSSMLYSGTHSGTTYRYPFRGGLTFATNLVTHDFNALVNNGEIRFYPVVSLACAP